MGDLELDFNFDLLQTGINGGIEVIPKQENIKDGQVKLPPHTLPVGLPPVLPDDKKRLEKFLSCPEELPIYGLNRVQRLWPRQANPESLYTVDVCPLQTGIVVERNPTTGQMLGIKEELLVDTGSSAKNSTSLRRRPCPPGESVRGSSTNYPFWPGGLDEPNLDKLQPETQSEEVDFEKDLLVIPPGFPEGVEFEKKALESLLKAAENPSILHVTDVLAHTDDIDLGLEEEPEEVDQNKADQPEVQVEETLDTGQNIDDVIKLDSRQEDVLVGQSMVSKEKEEWAVLVDVKKPVDDFYKKIPDMAREWPFELDTFQKQAILHLENHENVFVAAHTSAGKTVVAEYAIALSMKHMTRTVYTSPIKALSNQKFRDFKLTFGDVGLITGDVQLHPEAACLIMTTEILRSMLYNGSDVIRDLEWVVFDEVHYINDRERGVVWEEVLIMLPQHVNIILLSATVPNAMMFADWVGRIKRRKVYVVSTPKRPVPLEHFLYTGNSNKTSDELFKIVGADKSFSTPGYYKAVNAKKERSSKVSQNFGAKGVRGGNPHQDKNVWLSVIAMLKKKDQLPAVAFTFSKKRIEDNVQHLRSVDLTTSAEKSEVHIFFQKCISRLKGTDRCLPQVQNMQEILKKGLGIHHSGILPLLKEVVEMLFQKGLVKILFATETFAMGVNMPARTVVFDSIRKHDGTCLRDLLPGEYIQMAGRAGRRGLDTTGTVIILCKGDVPEMADLHKMMLGKPTQLESRFRLTYAMILNLFRVENLRVEDMMKRSFAEFSSQKDVTKHQQSMAMLARKMADMVEVVDYSGDLEDYYTACDEYFRLKTDLQDIIMSHPQAMKALSSGRVVIVDNRTHQNTLGLVLQAGPASSKPRTFTVLVICDQNQDSAEYIKSKNSAENAEADSDSQLPRPVIANQLFRPEGACGHEVLQIRADDISNITTKSLKVSTESVLNDWKKRQMPRFKHDPPGQACSVATQELLRLAESNPTGLPGLDPVKDLHMRDVDLVENFRRLQFLEEAFPKYRCIHDPSFQDNFLRLRTNRKMQEQYNHVRFLLSDESLQLLPEYQQRIQVLRELNYIDETNTVQLKGRVACEISNQELIITELVFENALTSLHPTEIAALLSCVVMEQKRCSQPNLSPDLVKAKDNFLEIARKIGELQMKCKVPMHVEQYLEQFNFNLMEVVFEWARGMPFSEITNLTDVQEGIIVRCIQRLDEVLRDVRNAARIIGDPVLYQKMEEASTMIKRDIVFAASLYTQ